ncbi:MAG: pantoate--beta-alanine ligase, partial [Candidatus Omnitrophica bacterium]|nr:pantoate--beta-alanine ligase [Candidatus Omnitrophota bacterium]
MKIVSSLKKMSDFSARAKKINKTTGFVPTMGALHDGHLSLIRRARRQADFIVVSIFVNPAQFGPKEDFKIYPRNFKCDAALCRKAGVDVIFYPNARDIYPAPYRTYVNVEGLSDCLCGRFRPGHFKGVATIVTKLFNIIRPDIAYFGSKDAQQALIIKKIASDLNMPVKVKIMPTVRSRDGLALSSRNAYLNVHQREDAVVLFEALNLAKKLIKSGSSSPAQVIRRMKQLI